MAGAGYDALLFFQTTLSWGLVLGSAWGKSTKFHLDATTLVPSPTQLSLSSSLSVQLLLLPRRGSSLSLTVSRIDLHLPQAHVPPVRLPCHPWLRHVLSASIQKRSRVTLPLWSSLSTPGNSGATGSLYKYERWALPQCSLIWS